MNKKQFSKVGAIVQYCGHDAMFVADIHEVEGAAVIVAAANRPIDEQLQRPAKGCTHHVMDFPSGGYWGKHRGILVVPKEQVKVLK